MNDRLHSFATNLDRIATGYSIFKKTPPYKLNGAHHFMDGASVLRHDNMLRCDKCHSDDCGHVVAAICAEIPSFAENAEKVHGAAVWTSEAVNVMTNDLNGDARNAAAFEIMVEHVRVKRAASDGLAALKALAADTSARLETGEIAAETGELTPYQREVATAIRVNGGSAAEIEHHLDQDGPRAEDCRQFLSFDVT